MFTYEIEQDSDPIDPRVDFDSAAIMACWHPRYDLGDAKKFWACPEDPEDFVAWAEREGVVYLDLYLYDHSGLRMNTTGFSCPWDSGQVGYIYMAKKQVIQEWGSLDIKRAEEYMRAEVDTYNMYLSGDVWGYIIRDSDGEEVDSCWGFYGHDHCEEEAKEQVAYYEEHTPKQYELPSMENGHGLP